MTRAMSYAPKPGDVLRLTSSDSASFAGPFEATVTECLTLTNGKAAVQVRVVPPAYFGPEPLRMREEDTFVLVARAAAESVDALEVGKPLSVHIATCKTPGTRHPGPLDPQQLQVEAWGELTLQPR